MPRKRREAPWFDRRPDNGVFYAYRYNPGKRRTEHESLETRDLGEAAQRFAKYLTAGPKNSRHVVAAGVTVEQLLDWYVHDHVEAVDDKGRIKVADPTRQRNAIAHLKAYFKDTFSRNVDIAASRDYAQARRSGVVGGGKRHKGVRAKGSDSTIRRELNVLIAAANSGLRHRPKYVTQADVPIVELPAETREHAPWLTKEAVRLLLSAAEGQLRAAVRLWYYWGARRESVEWLRKSQVDLRHGRVDLNPPNARTTVKRKPIVPVYDEIRPDLEALMAASDTEFVFGTPRNFYRDFVQLCEQHGIRAQDLPDDKTPWPHLLRHSRATHMLMDGEDPYKVAKLLGDTLATVERVYGHHSVDYLKTRSTVEEVA